MSQRIFILGGGRFGTHLASRLSEFGCEVVIADSNPKRVEDLAEDGFHSMEMDADDVTGLKAAGVLEADAVVVAIGENMQASILATLQLKELGVKKLIGRAVDVKHAQVLEKVGADLVVLPSRDMAYRLAERLRANSLFDRHPLSGDYQLGQIRINARLKGLTLEKARLPQNFHVTVVLISRTGPKGTVNDFEPVAEFSLAENDVLLVVGKREKINQFEKECGTNPIKG